jgi:large subunit ribosomal protein L13
MATDKSKSKSKTTKTASKKAAKAPSKAAKKPAVKASEVASEAKAKPSKKPAVARRPLMEKTFFAKTGELTPKWRLIDASGQTLGRLATYVATALMGKDKPTYTRSVDTGDFVVIINAEKISLTGKKWQDKVYQHHTGFPGGIKTYSAEYIRENHPHRLIEKAVWRMLPHGHMGRHWFSKLKVYAGTEHPHKAQQPELVKFGK